MFVGKAAAVAASHGVEWEQDINGVCSLLIYYSEEQSVKQAKQIIMVVFWKTEDFRGLNGKLEWILNSQETTPKQMVGFEESVSFLVPFPPALRICA